MKDSICNKELQDKVKKIRGIRPILTGKRMSDLGMRNLHSPNPLSHRSENELALERKNEVVKGAYPNSPPAMTS